jgi:TPR repeat protein
LAGAYTLGKGVPEVYIEARKWIRKAAEQGNVDAQQSLGKIYEEDVQDYIEAAKWYRKAAEQGDVTSQSYLSEQAGESIGSSMNSRPYSIRSNRKWGAGFWFELSPAR